VIAPAITVGLTERTVIMGMTVNPIVKVELCSFGVLDANKIKKVHGE